MAGTQLLGYNYKLYKGSVSFANSDTAGTTKTVDIPLDPFLQYAATYLVIVTNPSTTASGSDITVSVHNKVTFSSTARYPELTRFGVVKNNADGRAVLVQGMHLAEGTRLKISIDANLGADGAFAPQIAIFRL
jgi:hypothetical protein